MDSTAQRAPVGSEIINENRVAAYLEILNETASMDDAWIWQWKEPLWTQKSSTKLLSRVTHGFNSANSPCGLRNNIKNRVAVVWEILNKTAATDDAWIRQHKKPKWPQKSSTKLLPRVTYGFDSAKSPFWLRNHQRNCYQGWRVDSTAQTAPMDSENINENLVVANSEIINETAPTSDAWIRE